MNRGSNQRPAPGRFLAAVFAAVLSGFASGPACADVQGDARVFIDKLGLIPAARQVAALLKPSGVGLSAVAELRDPFKAAPAGAARSVLKQASAVGRILKPLARNAEASVFKEIVESEFFKLLPEGALDCGFIEVGRVRLVKRNRNLTIYAAVSGPGGTQALVGVSNDDPICDLHTDRMANEQHQPLAFIDMSEGGLSYVQVRMVLGTPAPPQITARSYVPVGRQNLLITFGAFDPKRVKVEAKLSLGLEGSIDEALSGDVGIQGELSFEVVPAKAASVTAAVASAMRSEAQRQGIGLNPTLRPSSRAVAGGFEVSGLDKTARVFQAGINKLKEIADADSECLGNAGVGVVFKADAGLGIWDTKMDAVSVGAGVSVSVPVAAAAQAGGQFVIDFLRQAVVLAPIVHQVGSGELGPQSQRLNEVKSQLAAAAEALGRSLARGASKLVENAEAEISVSIEAAGEKDQPGAGAATSDRQASAGGESGGAKKKAGTSTKVFEAKVKIPLGKGVEAALNGTALADLTRFLADLARAGGPFQFKGVQAPSLDYDAAAAALIDGTKVSIECTPVLPTGVTIEAELPAKALLAAASKSMDKLELLLDALNRGLAANSLGPIRDESLRALFSGGAQFADELRNGKFGIRQGFGGNADLGAEAAANVGLGYALYAEANPEMLFIFADPAGSDLPNVDGEAEIGFQVAVGADGEINLAEGAEITASAGLSATCDLLYLAFKEHDGPPPVPDEVTVAGFRVTNFQGTVNPDGSFSGSGDLQLPVGGSVRATFAVDRNAHVTSGSWSGSFTIRGRTFAAASGRLDDRGLHWNYDTSVGPVPNVSVAYTLMSDGSFSASGSVNYSIGGVQKQFVVSMDASGALSATYAGSVTLSGFNFANAKLVLSDSGATGTAAYRLPDGSEIVFGVTVPPSGTPSGSCTSDLTVCGWNLTQTSLSLDSTGVHGTARITLPGGRTANAAVTLSPSGRLGGSISGGVTVNGWLFGNTSLAIADDKISGTGTLMIPNGPGLSVAITITSNGGFSATGNGSVVLSGFEPVGVSYSVDTDKVSGSGSITLPGGSQAVLQFQISKTGVVTGSLTGGLTVYGWQIGSAALTLSEAGLTGTGNLILPGGASCSAAIVVTPDGRFGGSVRGALTIRGWQIGSADLTINNDSMTGSGTFVLPGGSSTGVSLTVKSGGSFTAISNSGISIGGWNLGGGSFRIADDTATAAGNIDLVGASAAFTFGINKNGTFTGHTSSNLSIPISQGKSVSVWSVSLDMQPNGTISGTGNLGLGNGTIASAAISISPGGSMTAVGFVPIGGSGITGTCSIGRGSFSITGSVTKSVGVSISGNSFRFTGTVALQVTNVTGVRARATGTLTMTPATGSSVSNSVAADVNMQTGEVEFEIAGFKPKFDLF